jgi:hypothetical protein
METAREIVMERERENRKKESVGDGEAIRFNAIAAPLASFEASEEKGLKRSEKRRAVFLRKGKRRSGAWRWRAGDWNRIHEKFMLGTLKTSRKREWREAGRPQQERGPMGSRAL